MITCYQWTKCTCDELAIGDVAVMHPGIRSGPWLLIRVEVPDSSNSELSFLRLNEDEAPILVKLDGRHRLLRLSNPVRLRTDEIIPGNNGFRDEALGELGFSDSGMVLLLEGNKRERYTALSMSSFQVVPYQYSPMTFSEWSLEVQDMSTGDWQTLWHRSWGCSLSAPKEHAASLVAGNNMASNESRR